MDPRRPRARTEARFRVIGATESGPTLRTAARPAPPSSFMRADGSTAAGVASLAGEWRGPSAGTVPVRSRQSLVTAAASARCRSHWSRSREQPGLMDSGRAGRIVPGRRCGSSPRLACGSSWATSGHPCRRCHRCRRCRPCRRCSDFWYRCCCPHATSAALCEVDRRSPPPRVPDPVPASRWVGSPPRIGWLAPGASGA